MLATLVTVCLALSPALAAPALQIVPERRAWAALLTGNVENMTSLALLQIHSVRRFSKHQTHITMVTPEVSEVARRQLRAAGSHVVQTELISPPWQIAASWWTTVFTKLAIFGLGNTTAGAVDKVAFIDLDAFIVDAHADSIFDACGANEVRRASAPPPPCSITDNAG